MALAAEWDPSGSLLRGQFALGFHHVLNLDLFYSLKETTGRDSLAYLVLPSSNPEEETPGIILSFAWKFPGAGNSIHTRKDTPT